MLSAWRSNSSEESTTPVDIDEEDDTETREADVQAEITSYFKLKTGIDENDVNERFPLGEFWKEQERRSHLPTMCRLARKLLATPASSVYSERLFSEFGCVYEN